MEGTPLKPGVRTSEFGASATITGMLFAIAQTTNEPVVEGIAVAGMAALGAVYAWSRTWLKGNAE